MITEHSTAELANYLRQTAATGDFHADRVLMEAAAHRLEALQLEVDDLNEEILEAVPVQAPVQKAADVAR